MQDFAVMAMLESEADLSEIVQYLIFCKVLENSGLLLVLVFVLDLGLKVSVVSIVHDNT